MANPDHVRFFLDGARVWNDWRAQNPEVIPDLSETDLTKLWRESPQRSGEPGGWGYDEVVARIRTATSDDARLFFGVDLHGADLRGAKCYTMCLVEANLSESNLTNADLTFTKLLGGNLSSATLHWADLTGADLSCVVARRARMTWADCTAANLEGADLSGAELGYVSIEESGALTTWAHGRGANFTQSSLRRARLNNASLAGTTFCGTDLSAAEGLDSCIHGGPSHVDIQTLLRSGRLPQEFLRGCGHPDNLIEYLPSLLNHAIQFYSCFISYSTKDQDFAERLHAEFQDKGVRCWFAPRDVQGGRKLHEQIDRAIRLHDRLLLILSEHSMNSEWVNTEIAQARQKEVNAQRHVLFPISLVPFAKIRDWRCFDADTGKDSAREIREYFIPDFSNWKDHDSYQHAFERLVKDLKAEEKGPARVDEG